VPAGTYSVTYKNATGCISFATSAVLNPNAGAPSAPVASHTDAGCGNLGSITVTSPTGSIIKYSIDGVNYQTSNIFSNLSAGTYNVTAKSTGSGCSSAATSVIVASTGTLSATINDVWVSSNHNGLFVNTIYLGYLSNYSSLTLTATVTGTGPFTYQWRDSKGKVVGTNNTLIVTGADTYTVIVTSGNCTVAASKIVHLIDATCGTKKVPGVAVCSGSTSNCYTSNSQAQAALDAGGILGACNSYVRMEVPTTPAEIKPVVNIAPSNDKNTLLNPESFKVIVAPNPSTTYFKIRVQSNSNEMISIKVFDALGRVVAIITGAQKNQDVTLGENYRGGSYFAEVVQGVNHKTVKLIKLN